MLQTESEAFALNRLFLEVQHEAFEIHFKENISLNQLDNIVEEHLFPGGIFRFFDSVGIDVMLASIRNYSNFESHGKFDALICALQEMVDKGLLGKKTGKGFYNYPETSVTKEDKPMLASEKWEEIVNRLSESYFKAASRTASTFGYPEAFVDQICKDYTGADSGPFEIYKQHKN